MSIDETCFGLLYACQNKSTCILKSQNLCVNNPRSERRCSHGDNGRWCENDLCLNLNCQHNGTCQRLSYEQAKCICTKSWYGNGRLITIRLNDGTCFNYPGSYRCQR